MSTPPPPPPHQPPLLFVIVGSSGVGKGSIASALAGRVPRLWLSRSWTSRPRRSGEAADAYRFVDRDTFLARVEAGGFIEWAEVFGHLYGTPVPDPPPGDDILLEIDVQGAAQVRERHPEAVVVLVQAPSREAQRERLVARGDDWEVIARRLARAETEEAKARGITDRWVVNDDLNRAVEEVTAIVYEQRIERRRAR